MGTNVFPHIYEKMVEEDIEWLDDNLKEDAFKDGLYYCHIKEILQESVREYKDRTYMERMTEKIKTD